MQIKLKLDDTTMHACLQLTSLNLHNGLMLPEILANVDLFPAGSRFAALKDKPEQ